MEAAHYALIQAEIDNIRQDGFWFGLPEFTLESERSSRGRLRSRPRSHHRTCGAASGGSQSLAQPTIAFGDAYQTLALPVDVA
jgi:hypothetical protein